MGKLTATKGFEKLPKFQKIAKSGHTGNDGNQFFRLIKRPLRLISNSEAILHVSSNQLWGILTLSLFHFVDGFVLVTLYSFAHTQTNSPYIFHTILAFIVHDDLQSYSKVLLSSVTRFGKIAPLWQKLFSFW